MNHNKLQHARRQEDRPTTHPRPHGPMSVLVRAWMCCAQPALLSEIRRGRHLIDRFDAEDNHADDLARMAADTDNAIRVLLDGMADEYGVSGAARRRLIAGAVGVALPVCQKLATVEHRPTGGC